MRTLQDLFRRRLRAGLIVAMVASSCSFALAQAGQPTASQGKEVYVAKGCYTCHGYVGQGATATGPAIAPLRMSVASFQAYVRHPAGVMPAYSPKIITSAELAAIAAYLQSVPRASPAASIPLLHRYADGAPAMAQSAQPNAQPRSTSPPPPPVVAHELALYQTNCAACHGMNREGGVGPALTGEAAKRSMAATEALIKYPPARMPQLYPASLSAVDVTAIAAYLQGAK